MMTVDSTNMRCALRKPIIAARWGILFFAVVVPALSGCTKYHIGVTTYLSHDLSFPTADSTTKIAVVTGTDPDEPLLEAEVKRKIERLVRGRGFETAGVDEADYILSAFFAIDTGNMATGARPV